VYVESESKKVGNLRVPERLIERMRASRCLRLEADVDTRVSLLLEDYAHFVATPGALQEKLDLLRDLHGAERMGQWKEHLEAGRWQPLVRSLLESHYDPAYHRSLARNYREAQSGPGVPVRDISAEGFGALARELAREHG